MANQIVSVDLQTTEEERILACKFMDARQQMGRAPTEVFGIYKQTYDTFYREVYRQIQKRESPILFKWNDQNWIIAINERESDLVIQKTAFVTPRMAKVDTTKRKGPITEELIRQTLETWKSCGCDNLKLCNRLQITMSRLEGIIRAGRKKSIWPPAKRRMPSPKGRRPNITNRRKK